MSRSATIRAALALPVLSALALVLVSAPSPAQTSRALAPNLTPGQARVMTAAAATVVSSVHYQAELDLSCGGYCGGDFPAPGAHHQLTVTRVSCLLESSGASTVQTSWIELVTFAGKHVLYQQLPVDYSNTGAGVH